MLWKHHGSVDALDAPRTLPRHLHSASITTARHLHNTAPPRHNTSTPPRHAALSSPTAFGLRWRWARAGQALVGSRSAPGRLPVGPRSGRGRVAACGARAAQPRRGGFRRCAPPALVPAAISGAISDGRSPLTGRRPREVAGDRARGEAKVLRQRRRDATHRSVVQQQRSHVVRPRQAPVAAVSLDVAVRPVAQRCGDVDEGAAHLAHDPFGELVQHRNVLPAVLVRRRVVDGLGQRPVGDVVAIVVANVARDNHHLLAPLGVPDAARRLVERAPHVRLEADVVGVEPRAHLQHQDRVRRHRRQPRILVPPRCLGLLGVGDEKLVPTELHLQRANVDLGRAALLPVPRALQLRTRHVLNARDGVDVEFLRRDAVRIGAAVGDGAADRHQLAEEGAP
mmetsp:Transcript_36169/g.84522  ORF Transcript_36169/g.84522 Transcript_36169/m.84522 type:complete len:396 (+) Transcript_36169:140-1327(+)